MIQIGIALMLQMQRATLYPRPATDGGGTARNAETILGGTGERKFVNNDQENNETSDKSERLND